MSEWRGKSILMVGAARSGIAVVQVLSSLGANMALYDDKPANKLSSDIENLNGISYDKFFGIKPTAINHFDAIIISPGVPLNTPLIVEAYKSGIPVLSEIEIAYLLTKSKIIAITGTNGKTTTTTLTWQIFKDAGRPVRIGGNIGNPLIIEAKHGKQNELLVAEVSSFQLETIASFKPTASAFLNFSPDHIDRHGSIENYQAAKMRILENQRLEDFVVLNYDDEMLRNLTISNTRKIYFSRHAETNGVFVRDGVIYSAFKNNFQSIIKVEEIKLPGTHNLENTLAAVTLALAFDISPETIANTLRTFAGVPHRLEFVAEIDGIRYINDSKGTNPDSTIKALEAYNRPIVLIAGGKNKGSDFHDLALKIKERVKHVVLVGLAAPEIANYLKAVNYRDISYVDNFTQSVNEARLHAENGDIVLLSPACTSWDMFTDFEQRGNLFKELVYQIRR